MSELLHLCPKFARKYRSVFFSGNPFPSQMRAFLHAIKGSFRALEVESADIVMKVVRKDRPSWSVSKEGALEIAVPFYPSKNHVLAKLWEEDVERCFDAATTLSGESATWSVISNVAEARDCIQAITAKGEHVVDVETFAPVYSEKFKIVCMASSAPGLDHVWVWPEEALTENSPLRDEAITLLKSCPMVAHNLKYELSSFSRFFGVKLGPECCAVDTLALSKLELSHCSPALENWTGIAGMGGHKDEAGTLVKEAASIVAKARVKAKKEIPVAWEYRERTTKTGKLQRRKVVSEKRKPTEDEIKKSAKEALQEKLGPLIKNLDDWVDAVVSDYSKLSFAYGLADRSVIMKYCALDVLSTSRLRRVLAPVEKKFSPVLSHYKFAPWAISNIEQNGMMMDEEMLSEAANTLSSKEQAIRAEIGKSYPGVNPTSTRDVSDLLFNKLKKKPIKLTSTEQPSCDKATLQEYADEKVIADILDLREIAKINGTYATGLLKKISADGRIRPSLNATGAETGRFSCSGPNLQNIPSRGKLAPMIKKCFVVPEGYKMVQIDYSTLEVRIVAMLSGDRDMIEIFKRGGDFHREAAIKLSKVLWGSSFEDCGGLEGEELQKEQKRRRTVIKGVVFGTIYGQTPEGLAATYGIDKKQAKAAQEALLGEFSDFGKWVKSTKAFALREGKVFTTWAKEKGRCRHLPKYGQEKTRKEGERQAVNTPVQGSGAEYCTASLVAIEKYIWDSAIDARVIMTVHDSIIVEVHELDVDEYCANAKRIMESWYAGGVPIKVDIEIGKNWAELEIYESKKE